MKGLRLTSRGAVVGVLLVIGVLWAGSAIGYALTGVAG